MRKTLYFIVVMSAIAAISGCITVKKVVRERVDQDITGNRGYIQGQAPEKPPAAKSRRREYIDIRVEIPTLEEVKGAFPKPEEKQGMPPAEEGVTIEEPYAPEPEIEEPAAVRTIGHTSYKVKEGDMLGHIAKKFYGKASKWTLIYEANMDKIGDPGRLKPGTELVIPDLAEESGYVK